MAVMRLRRCRRRSSAALGRFGAGRVRGRGVAPGATSPFVVTVRRPDDPDREVPVRCAPVRADDDRAPEALRDRDVLVEVREPEARGLVERLAVDLVPAPFAAPDFGAADLDVPAFGVVARPEDDFAGPFAALFAAGRAEAPFADDPRAAGLPEVRPDEVPFALPDRGAEPEVLRGADDRDEPPEAARPDERADDAGRPPPVVPRPSFDAATTPPPCRTRPAAATLRVPPRRAIAPRRRTGTPSEQAQWSTVQQVVDQVAGQVVEQITDWFAGAARDLPWRAPDRTPWGVLVSEVMLQQTPVVRVEPVWREWTARWPSPADLAAAPTADVLRAWGRLGYPRRALRLADCARAIVERHDGVVPDDEDALRALPGVGEYTAAAVRAFAFGRRSVVVDTNVRRVQARAITGVALPAPSYTAAERLLAASLVPADDAGAARWAAASMELGALVCTARVPRCGACPVRAECAWRLAGFPPDAHADRRRTQSWEGTDRQVRGRVMAALRGADEPVPRALLADAGPQPQLDRCLAGLVEDGLAETDEAGRFLLPA
jgi:A/G-specific adenine glycosylase